jgi:inhibitor of KinA
MTGPAARYPCFRPVADQAVLVEFGATIARDVHDEVRKLDAALARAPFAGFTEAVPAYTNLLVGFDPITTDHQRVEAALTALMKDNTAAPAPGTMREVLVCYDAEFALDLPEVAQRTGLSAEDVIAAHLAGDYHVFMYGFVPGFAYMAGVPQAIQIPRKASPVRGIASGSVLMAGPQCLVTTWVMPTGWWIIGRSPTRILRSDDADRPFLFDVGDDVHFRRIDRATFDREEARNSP